MPSLFQSLFQKDKPESNDDQNRPLTVEEKHVLNQSIIHSLQSSTSSENEKDVISGERNKLAVILSAINDGVIALDLNRNIISFNKAAEKITGYTANQVINKPIKDVLKFFDYQAQIDCNNFCPANPNNFEGIVFNRVNVKVIGAAEKITYVNLISSQIIEGNRVNLGCVITLHDVSDEKHLEEMKLDFISMAAHELRTPLTSIKGYLSIFTNENKDKFNSEQNMFLTRMNIATQQLMGLIDNLLNVSRIERGMFTVNLEKAKWEAIVQQVVDMLRERAVDKQIELTFIKPVNPLPKIYVDKLRIPEVLTNLLSNAIAYTQPGGKIEVWTEIDPSHTQIITHVRDNGQGIPQEAIPHLFTKFFRVAGKLEQGSKGTGLGLYISKSIVDLHHGKIWVNSELDKGSVFSFSLPIETERSVTL